MRAFIALVSALWHYATATQKRMHVIIFVMMFVISNAIYMAEPYVVGQIMNGLQHATLASSPLGAMLRSLTILFALTIGFWAFHGPARILENTVAFHIRVAQKNHLFSILTSLPAQWHKNHHSGQSINRMRKATSALFDFSSNTFQLIEMAMRPTSSIIALFFIMPVAAAIALTMCIAALVMVFLFDRVLLPQYQKINDGEHYEASALHDYITNIITVITLRLETLAQTEVMRRMTSYFSLYKKNNVINECKWFFASALIAGMVSVTLGWYTYTSIASGILPLIGTLYMLYEYLQRIGGAFYTFAWKYGQIVQQYADLQSAKEILEADRAEYHSHHLLPQSWKILDIQHLNFKYENEEERTHIQDVSLQLERKKRIAFVGESGSGKSTIMAIIRGLQVANAEVYADDKRLPDGLKHLSQHVTLIPQEPEIFENTIEYNVTLDTDQQKELVEKNIELARFTSVLSRLPKGLATNIAEKGVNLSGGEKQRLALARGFFAAKDSDIILLDEPTSSVDPANERMIYENLFKEFSEQCIVSSIHKLFLLPMFDIVYVFREGKLIATGTPKELTDAGGVLHDLWIRERDSGV